MKSGEERELKTDEFEEEAAPKPNGDLATWLYVILGIPCMALFFVVYFGLVGSCDASNVMISG